MFGEFLAKLASLWKFGLAKTNTGIFYMFSFGFVVQIVERVAVSFAILAQ